MDPRLRTFGDVDTEAGTGGGPARPRAGPADARDLGRYEVLELIGQGGMGVVHRARDPRLRREVALKVLHPDARTDPAAAGRLLREARAMARLDHPNVVRIFDVGRSGESVFLAMELIEGEDFRALLRGARRPWRVIVDLYSAAGRGLAAAHAVGLVHRDFKPGNVMRARDGSVRVLDFGLATGPRTKPPAILATSEDETDLAGSRAGTTAGTPAYMAPEQIRGAEVDARADQFAFCVSMWEALFGERPFRGDTWPALAASVLEDEPHVPAHAAKVPRALFSALRRGLEKDPAARHHDMLDLLTAIARASAPRSRRIVPAVFGAGLALAVVSAGLPGGGSACDEAGDLEKIWSSSARARVLRRLALEPDAGVELGARVVASLDAWADEWSSARRDACMRRELEPEVADRRLACLQSRGRELSITVDALRSGGDLARAVQAASALPRLDGCADDEALAAGTAAIDPADATRIDALAPELATAGALGRVGRAVEGRDRLLAIESRVAEVGDPLFRARYEMARGQVENTLGRIEASEQAFARGFALAMEGRDDELALRFAGVLVFLHAEHLRRFDAADRWAHQGEALASRVDDQSALADLWSNIGALRSNQGRLDEAIALHDRALALREETFGPDDPRVAVSLNNLGVAKLRAGRFAEAEALHRRALAVRESAEGPLTADVGSSLFNLGNTILQAGRPEDARPLLERAVAVFEHVYGPEDRRLVAALGNLGAGLLAVGEDQRAREVVRRAHGILARALGDDHPETAEALGRLGTLAAKERDWERAVPDLEEALRVLDLSYDDHPHVALLLNNLASCLCELGRVDECIAHHRRALEMRSRLLPPEHPHLAVSRRNLGEALTRAGRLDEALAELDRALEVPEVSGAELGGIFAVRAEVLVRMGRIEEAVAPAERAIELLSGDEDHGSREDERRARFTLAKVRWGSGRLLEAREGLDALLESYREDPDGDERAIEEIVRWRAEAGA